MDQLFAALGQAAGTTAGSQAGTALGTQIAGSIAPTIAQTINEIPLLTNYGTGGLLGGSVTTQGVEKGLTGLAGQIGGIGGGSLGANLGGSLSKELFGSSIPTAPLPLPQPLQPRGASGLSSTAPLVNTNTGIYPGAGAGAGGQSFANFLLQQRMGRR